MDKTITFKELYKLITSDSINDSKFVLIDVREPSEIKLYSKIPKSINIPLGKLESELKKSKYIKLKNDGYKFIFYCMSGGRSTFAVRIAKTLGFESINYSGSFTDWVKNNRLYGS